MAECVHDAHGRVMVGESKNIGTGPSMSPSNRSDDGFDDLRVVSSFLYVLVLVLTDRLSKCFYDNLSSIDHFYSNETLQAR